MLADTLSERQGWAFFALATVQSHATLSLSLSFFLLLSLPFPHSFLPAFALSLWVLGKAQWGMTHGSGKGKEEQEDQKNQKIACSPNNPVHNHISSLQTCIPWYSRSFRALLWFHYSPSLLLVFWSRKTVRGMKIEGRDKRREKRREDKHVGSDWMDDNEGNHPAPPTHLDLPMFLLPGFGNGNSFSGSHDLLKI